MKSAHRLTAAVAVLMLAQSVLGLLYRGQYRDVEWIAATWLGNDWVTLGVASPSLGAGLVLTRHGSARGLLLWLGTLGYAIYNYAYDLFGAAGENPVRGRKFSHRSLPIRRGDSKN